jgi:uncharacterized NAD-dependent epimerase/dehydratase family protein
MLSSRPVVAITVNHENLDKESVPSVCREVTHSSGLPAFDVIIDGASGLAETVLKYLKTGRME